MLFEPGSVGTLHLPNRLVRSATAERMADDDGWPRPELRAMYERLARGGAGLIITGHMYVHRSGRCHREMTAIDRDDVIPALAELAQVVHQAGGHIVAQINHGGMQCSPDAVLEAIAPSATDYAALKQPARAMTVQEIHGLIDAYAQAARRAQQAGCDGVQLHGAHGYLINQFLSPFVNQRSDEWGGDLPGRMHFLRAVCQAVRAQVGPSYPLLIKLGMIDSVEGGLTPDESVPVVAALETMGIDAVEISGGIGGVRNLNTRPGVRPGVNEAYFRPLAQQARQATRLPLLLVGGFRSRRTMEEVLSSGDADLISLCRPLICEPDLPQRMRKGLQEESVCISANRCWADHEGDGIACKCRTRHGRVKPKRLRS